jgi:hypothetical protein
MSALEEDLIGGATVDGGVALFESTLAMRATEPTQFTDEDDECKT